MKNVLPVPVSESYYWGEYEEVFYHNGKQRAKWCIYYKDKSVILDKHKYKTVIKYKTAFMKDEYKSYNVAIPKRVVVSNTTTEIE